MHLKEIVLDGFKSYAVRTVVSGFDREFNAITGLNGSGKSNILDSICFVLGISNLSQVRRRRPAVPASARACWSLLCDRCRATLGGVAPRRDAPPPCRRRAAGCKSSASQR